MVKKLYVFIMISIMTVASVCGCSAKKDHKVAETTSVVETTAEETQSVDETETEPSLENETEIITEEVASVEETTTEETTEAATTAVEVTEPETPAPTQKETEQETTTQKQTEPPTTTQAATEAPTKASKPTEKQTEAPTKKQEETTTSYWAMQEDAPEIAKRVIKYLNDYRAKEGTFKLVQGTKEMQAFADLRSQQLVKNFAHDDDDTLAAVKKLNYGEFWSDGWVQAFSESTEAIYMSYTSGEIDEVAKSIVDGFHGSKRHWAYLGNVDHEYEELKYVAVGLTYNKGFWYCAIWMDSEQHTGPVYFD